MDSGIIALRSKDSTPSARQVNLKEMGGVSDLNI